MQAKGNQNIFDFVLQAFGTLENLFTDVLVPNSLPVDQEVQTNQEININAIGKGDDDVKMKIIEQGLVMGNGDILKLILPPFFSDLLTWHKTIIETTFAESIENLPGKVLPRVASFNGGDDYVNLGNSPDLAFDRLDPFTFATKITPNNVGASHVIIGKETGTSNFTGYLLEINTDKKLRLVLRQDGSPSNQIQVGGSTILQIGVTYDAIITYDGSSDASGVKIYLNSILETLNIVVNTLTNSILNSNNAAIGSRQGNTAQSLFDGLINDVRIWNRVLTMDEITAFADGSSISNTGLQVSFRLSGQGDYEYDVSGNENHGTWSGTGDRYTYDLEGSDYLNVNGYSLWQHATLEDIQVPFDITGNALSLTPGTDIPAGYTKTRDVLSGGTKWNMADALIGFNETESANTALEFFDRSNVTRQTAASRASAYYDATNLATKSRYHINEISDPRIYDTFFEPASKDKVFAKVLLAANDDVIRLDEVPNYATQKTGQDKTDVTDYCKIQDIYP